MAAHKALSLAKDELRAMEMDAMELIAMKSIGV